MWIQTVSEIAKDGVGIGKYRLTVRSDEGGGGPYGGCEHDHDTKDEAEDCIEARIGCGRMSGFPPECDSKGPNGERCRKRLGHDDPKFAFDGVASPHEGEREVSATW